MTAPTLISRDASTAIKGLLMLLIVFGHTGLLTTDFTTGERTFLFEWLYTFHVHIFMILPFIYGYSQKPIASMKEAGENKLIDIRHIKSDLKHNLIKIGVPYFWFFIIDALVFVIIAKGEFNFGGMLYAFFFGSQTLMSKYIGFNMMWFLPALLALTLLKSIWYNSKKTVKISMLTISFILWLLCIIRVVEMDTVGLFVPFALSQGFYYLLLGLLSRYLLEKFPAKKMAPWALIGIVMMTILFYMRNKLEFNPFWIVRMIMPVLVFIFLFTFTDFLSKSRVLHFLGTYSLQIYLIHVIIINVLNSLFLHFMHASIIVGVIVYVLTLIISSGVSLMMVKLPIINKVLFPKG